MFRGRRPNKPRGNRRRPTNPARVSRGSHVHLYSSRIHMLTTKSNHKKVEIYPIPISDLFDESAIGSDTDIRMVGYKLDISIPAGNNMSSIEANIAHSGPWVRRSTAGDTFNQNFRDRRLNRSGHVFFNKRVLPSSEREYLSPHKDPANLLNLKVVDVAGVIPGVAIVIKATIHFVRCHIPTMVSGADQPATDKYEDQDINGASPSPPAKVDDIPLLINYSRQDYATTDTASPFRYTNPLEPTIIFTVTLASNLPVNKVGQLVLVGAEKDYQQLYTNDGYVGVLTVQS